MECLRAELAEAKSEISKLQADMAGRRSGGFRHGHDQLEELRNLQENISRERQEWDKKKEEERLDLQKEREALGRERRRLEEEKVRTINIKLMGLSIFKN